MSKKLAILVSGTGSLLEYFLIHDLAVDLVLSDRPCRGIDVVAKTYNIPREPLHRIDFGENFDRAGYTRKVLDALRRHKIDVVAMAGFNTIFDPLIFSDYPQRILNTHPALLPAFKGHYAVRDALEFGVKLTGCTIHIATPELDAGPILAQVAVEVLLDDTEGTLHERIKKVERVLYLQTIRNFMTTLQQNERAPSSPLEMGLK